LHGLGGIAEPADLTAGDRGRRARVRARRPFPRAGAFLAGAQDHPHPVRLREKPTRMKQEILAALRIQAEAELTQLKAAAAATHDAATNEESKPENQYDTRALEASYLADAQAKRVMEMEEVLHSLRSVQGKELDADAAIQAG